MPSKPEVSRLTYDSLNQPMPCRSSASVRVENPKPETLYPTKPYIPTLLEEPVEMLRTQ